MIVRKVARSGARSSRLFVFFCLLLGLAQASACGAPKTPPADNAGGAAVQSQPVSQVPEADDETPVLAQEAEPSAKPDGVNATPPHSPMEEVASLPPSPKAVQPTASGSGYGLGAVREKKSGGQARRDLSPLSDSMDTLSGNLEGAPVAERRRAAPAKLKGRARPAALQVAAAPPAPDFNTEAYAHLAENPFQQVVDTPLSTFSVDVDTASYTNVRRMLQSGQRPQADAVRIEEFINYFRYDYPEPQGDTPLSIYTEVASSPWNPTHRLVHIGLRGKSMDQASVPARNLVFLLDVSGSMNSPDKLPLLKQGMEMLVRNLRPEDRVAIVVYAGASGLVLPSTRGTDRNTIREALQRLEAGGSTNGADGIELAYAVAQDHFIPGGINRVILATDGDFNVGATSHGALTRLIEDKRKSGVFLTVLGFGSGNLKDTTMETLADKGNGNYAYIDSPEEAHKVLVREAGSTLVTIAKDVKLQVEWNPSMVQSYRLIGYENRVMAARDFNDDKKDAGDMGAGHTVTALYEVVLRQGEDSLPEVDPLKYQQEKGPSKAAQSSELLTVKFRYKQPSGSHSQLLTQALKDSGKSLADASDNFRFSAAVAGFGLILRDSEYRGSAQLRGMQSLARGALGHDPHGDRRKLLELMDMAGRLGIDG